MARGVSYALRPRPRPTPPGPKPSPPRSRSRRTTGSATTPSTPAAASPLRHNSRLHHIGLGAARRGTRVTLLIDNLHIRVIGRDTGQLPPITAPSSARSRSQGWPQAIRWATALTPARTLPPQQQPPSRHHQTTPEMQRCPKTPVNGVARYHRELARGLEPLTCCLQDSCATGCATPA